jgi:hypothetical protein
MFWPLCSKVVKKKKKIDLGTRIGNQLGKIGKWDAEIQLPILGFLNTRLYIYIYIYEYESVFGAPIAQNVAFVPPIRR